MSTKPFNSVGGYSVGDESVSNIILANGDITTTNLTTTGVANLGNVGNVVISGGSANYLLQTDGSGNLTWTAPAATLTVYESNANAGNISNTTSNVSGILFDRDSGFQVYDIGNSNVLISLGSTFKTWIVDGQPNLVAQGEDEVQFIAGNNLIITTSNIPNPPTQLYKYIRFDADVHYVSNGTSNIDLPTANGNINFSVDGNANIAIITSTGIVANTIEVGDIYSKRNSIAVTSNTVIDSFGVAEYRSAKYSIRASDDTGYQAVEVLLIHNDINSYITIYGSLSMTGNDLVTLSSTINGSNVELLATGVGANTLVNLIGLYIPD